MKIEKAIEYLRDRKYLQITDWKVKSYDLAISALEKQLNGGWIPFKIEYDEDYKMGG